MIRKVIFGVLVLWAFVLSYYYISNSANAQNESSTVPSSISSSRQTAITRAVEKAAPAVVGINVTQVKRQRTNSLFLDPFWGGFFPKTRTYTVENLGSGVVISPDGYTVTNAHVVEDAFEIIVTMPGGKQFYAELIGLDNLTDLALLKIDEKNMPYAAIGNSEDLLVGEWAIALGNPLGLFDVGYMPTATAGIISGLHLNFGQKEAGRVYQDMIQTDASINPGNSGGPLVNANGELIGINTFIMTGSGYSTGSIGIGFAIPINRVQEIIEDLKKYGKVERNFRTGVQVQTVDYYLQKYLHLPSAEGVIITDVEYHSAGEDAGLQIGDIILKVDNRPVNSRDEILKVIDEGFHKAGDDILLDVWRDGKNIQLNLELAERK